MPANLFLTGPMRYGKSTLLCNVITKTGISVGGYFIQRLFTDGQTKAFRMADVSMESYVPDIEIEAEQINDYSDIIGCIGDNMSWHAEVFEETGVSIIRKGLSSQKSFLLMDELGRIELKAPNFQKTVFAALDSRQPVIGILKQESNPFLDKIRNREDVRILDLNQMTHQAARLEMENFITVNSDVPTQFILGR